MKKLLLICFALVLGLNVMAQYKVDTIKYVGDSKYYIDIVFLGDGFKENELDKFVYYVDKDVSKFFEKTPWKQYQNMFNVFYVKTPSNESGAGDTPDKPIDNIFGTCFGTSGVDRMPWPTKWSKVYEVLNSTKPDYDMVAILVNRVKSGGGGGGRFICYSIDENSIEVLRHESGHAIGGLADEYWYNGYERPNQTQDITNLKWNQWVGCEEVGTYRYSDDPSEEAYSWYRPHQNCLMRFLNREYCAVCREALIESFHMNSMIIKSYSPKNNKVLEIKDSPKTFSLKLLKPSPNTLRVKWMIDGIVIAKNESKITLEPTMLEIGKHTLSVNVEDTTRYVRTTGHTKLHASVVEWELSVTANTKVKLSKTEAFIEKGKTLTLKATVTPSDLSDKSVTWKSSDTKVATVTSAGKVKGVQTGTVTITCTSNSTGAKATCKVTVGSVKLDQTEMIVEKTKTKTLTATVYPSTLTDKSVTWESSDTKIATVTSTGKVKGVKTGTATITCTSNATGLSTTCEVTVGSVKLDQAEASVEKGKTVTLKATAYPSTLKDKTVTWTSSNTAVATVSSSGKVKGVKTGTATITCTSNATGLSTTCEVTVGSVKLDQTEVAVKKGETVTLNATVYPSTLEDKTVTWTSSNTAVATVSSNGKVKGVKTGTVTITCTSNATGLSTTCEVTVGSVKLNLTEVTINKGKTVTLKATVYPSTLADKSVTWKSSNTSIATVTAEGKVKGIKAGTATITCTSVATGLSVTCKVTVAASAATRSLELNDNEMTGINDQNEDSAIKPFDVYDLSGRKVLHQVTSLDGLPDGIYIVNDRKVLKKQ